MSISKSPKQVLVKGLFAAVLSFAMLGSSLAYAAGALQSPEATHPASDDLQLSVRPESRELSSSSPRNPHPVPAAPASSKFSLFNNKQAGLAPGYLNRPASRVDIPPATSPTRQLFGNVNPEGGPAISPTFRQGSFSHYDP